MCGKLIKKDISRKRIVKWSKIDDRVGATLHLRQGFGAQVSSPGGKGQVWARPYIPDIKIFENIIIYLAVLYESWCFCVRSLGTYGFKLNWIIIACNLSV